MLINCSKDDLWSALQTVQKGAATQTTLQILSGILLKTEGENLILQATNLEMSIMASIPVNVKKQGTVVVPARLIADIVKNLPDSAIEIGTDEKEDRTLKISTQQLDFKIKTMPPEDFPAFPEVNEETSITVGSADLQEVLKQTLKAVSRDETRPILNGCLLVADADILKVVATDSYRLAVRELKLKEKVVEKIDMVVPWRALDELQKILSGTKETTIGFSDNQIVFRLDGITFISRLIEGQFPNYQQLLPKDYGLRAEINRDTLAGAVTRASILAQKNQSVKLRLDGDKLWVSSQAQGVGEANEEIAIDPDGKGDFEIAFNAQYLLDGISAMNDDSLILELNNAASPGLIRSPKRDDFFYLIMPIRLGA